MTKKKKIITIICVILAIAIVIGGISAFSYFYIPKDKQYAVETLDAKEEGKIKVGIVSDNQLPEEEKNLSAAGYATVTEGAAHLWHSLKYFKEQNVDMIVFNGDVVNSSGDNAGYHIFNKMLDEIFGEDRENMPHIVFPMGNHEFYGANQEQKYYHFTGLPMNTSTTIDGYSFIAISNSKTNATTVKDAAENDVPTDGGYNKKRIAFLEEQLKAAAERDPNKPIFVFMHMPVSEAIPGGQWSTPEYPEIYNILKQYPQVVLFTSHSHYCLADERSIAQKDFTMVNTGTSSYFDFDWLGDLTDKENKFYGLTDKDLFENSKEVLQNADYYIHPELLGLECPTDVAYRNEVNNGLLLEIDTNQNAFTLTKLNLTTGVKFGEPFTMNKFTPDAFTRTAEQIGQGRKPYFDSNYMDVKVEGNNATVSFNAANQSVPVKYYLYVLTDATGKQTPIRFFARSFISGTDYNYTEQNVLHSLEKGSYTLAVYPINSYGLVGDCGPTASFTVE